MKYTVAAYRDKDTEHFNPPMLFPFPEESVIETIRQGAIKGKIEGCEAFELYILGTYDTATAKFELFANPKKVFNLSEFVKKA